MTNVTGQGMMSHLFFKGEATKQESCMKGAKGVLKSTYFTEILILYV